MAKKNKTSKSESATIALNRKARHEYEFTKHFEAGIVLEGWEVKSIREGKANIADSYVLIKEGEAWLLGAQITPLLSASTHINPDPQRTRKLLLHKKELNELTGNVERKGFAIVALKMYWSKGKIKLDIALAKGKKLHDKRQTIKEREWQRSKERLDKQSKR